MSAREIRRLEAGDLAAVVAFGRQQGLGAYGEPEWGRLLELGAGGCFGAFLDAHLVGVLTSVNYGGVLAWLGVLLVDAAQRRQGMGAALLAACLDATQAARVMLDAPGEALPFYRRHGFRALYRVQRWQGQATEFFGRRAERIKAADMGSLIAFDEQHFGAPRGVVLLRLQAEFPRLAWLERDRRGRIHGYILARHESGSGEVVLGPWMHQSPWGAATLLATALGAVRGKPVRLDVIDRNLSATPVVADHGLYASGHLTRMIWGEADPPADEPGAIFATASPFLG